MAETIPRKYAFYLKSATPFCIFRGSLVGQSYKFGNSFTAIRCSYLSFRLSAAPQRELLECQNSAMGCAYFLIGYTGNIHLSLLNS